MSPAPVVPPDTHTWVDAQAHGYYGIRADPMPDTVYEVSGAAGTNPPHLTACQPSTGPAGTVLNLGGTNLTGTVLVAVGQAPATGVTVVDDTKVTAVVPAGEGQVGVGVLNAAGVANLAGAFTYTAAEEAG